MFQWIRQAPVAFAGLARPAVAALPDGELLLTVRPRAAHAKMLADAAARRRRAVGEDRAYWRAVAPQALARARALRTTNGFTRLP